MVRSNHDDFLAFSYYSVFGQELNEYYTCAGRTRSEKQQQLDVQKGRDLQERLALRRSNGESLLLSTFRSAHAHM